MFIGIAWISPSIASRFQRSFSPLSHSKWDHRCGLGVTPLPLRQRARVQSPVGSIFWFRFLRGFSSTVRQMFGNLGHIHPRVSFGHHNHPKSCSSVYGRRRSLTLAVVHGRRSIDNTNQSNSQQLQWYVKITPRPSYDLTIIIIRATLSSVLFFLFKGIQKPYLANVKNSACCLILFI